MKKLLDGLEVTIKWLFTTKIGWVIICFLLGFLILKLSDLVESEFLYWLGLGILVLYPAGLTLVAIAFAWVINPYREWKDGHNK